MGSKTTYLVLYNLIQVIGNLCVLASIIRSNLLHGDGRTSGFEAASPILRILLLMQWLEIMHSILRLSKGSPVASLIQVAFKSVIFFLFLDSFEADETVRASTAASFLIFIWCLADCIRYPFYLQTLLHREFYLIKWLRHSAWIVLYPIGISLEAVVVYRSIPHIRQTGRLSFPMPNLVNMAVDPVVLIHVYLYFGVVVGSYSMLSYMWGQRRRALIVPPVKSSTPSAAAKVVPIHDKDS